MRNVLIIALFLVPGTVAARVDFFIEQIRLEGVRFTSERVVLAESRLIEGRTYSEAEIAAAVSRIRRLPFIIGARLSLAKGSERGKYILVLRVDEVKPFFVDYRSTRETFEVERSGTRETSRISTSGEMPSVGARLFLSSRTALTASAEIGGGQACCQGDPQYTLALTQWFDSGASITAIAQYREYAFDYTGFPQISGEATTSFGDHLSWGVAAALPVSNDQAIHLSAHRLPVHMLETRGKVNEFSRHHHDDLLASWRYDTRDDLLFPRSGAFAEGGIAYRRRAEMRATEDGLVAHDRWKHAFEMAAGKYWQWSNRQTLSATFTGVAGNQGGSGAIRGGYHLDLWQSTHADLVRFDFTAGIGGGTGYDTHGLVGATLAYRNPWGTLRFEINYYGWRP